MQLLTLLALATTALTTPVPDPILGLPSPPRPTGRPYCYEYGRNLNPNYAHFYRAAFGTIGSLAAACRVEPNCRYLATDNNGTPFGEAFGLLYNVTLDQQQFQAGPAQYPSTNFYVMEREGLDRCYSGRETDYLLYPVTGPRALERGKDYQPYPGTFPN